MNIGKSFKRMSIWFGREKNMQKPVCLYFNNENIYVVDEHEDYVVSNICLPTLDYALVKEIRDVSECDGSSFYIPCWEIVLEDKSVIRIENMSNLVVYKISI
jgi:hypothetical protein